MAGPLGPCCMRNWPVATSRLYHFAPLISIKSPAWRVRGLRTPGTPSRRILRSETPTGRLRALHAPSGLVLGQLDARDPQQALWVGLNPLEVCWGRPRKPLGCISATSWGRGRGSSRGCCGRLFHARRAGHSHSPRGPLGPVGCGGGRGAPPCASHRPISTPERPSPARWAAPEARGLLRNPKLVASVRPLVGLWSSGWPLEGSPALY